MLARSVLIFVLFFGLGIFLGSFFNFAYFVGLLFLLFGFVFFLLFRFLKFSQPVFILAIIFLATGSAMFWYGFNDARDKNLASVLAKNLDSRVSFSGLVSDEPDERENYTRFAVEISEGEETGVKILVYMKHYPVYKYGDAVKIFGVLKKPEKFSSDIGEKEFDWPAYLAKDGIFFEMFYPKIELISSGNGSWLKRRLFSLKENFLSNTSRIIPEPASALLGGLTVGARRSMPKELLEDFRKTGIVHLVVLSGYNVTIVADAIMRLLSFLPLAFGIGFGILGIALFAIMTGASATVVRAAIMAGLVLLARATGRIYHIATALFVAGFIMVLQNPKILRFHYSFQLSFLATLALIYVAPVLAPRLAFLPKKSFAFGGKLREIASMTISTQLFVLPLLLYKSGLFSVVSLPVNLLILPFIPFTMFFGFVAGGLGFISNFLAAPFGWLAYGLLAYEIKIVEFFAGLPFSSFNIPDFPLWLMLLVYGGYIILIFGWSRPQNK